LYFKTADIEGLRLFYREAGESSKPTIVLLHGFPSSLYQFHDLIPLLWISFMSLRPTTPAWGSAKLNHRLSCDRSSESRCRGTRRFEALERPW
jgi:pimeloyl-ACP methyl ester carboxylesterase